VKLRSGHESVITDRVIALIETQANMAGIEKAKAGFMGLNLSTVALAVALGGLILVGKEAIKNTEAMDKAHLSLQQATKASRESYSALQAVFDKWAEANKRYIPDQYAAEIALAAFTRAGANAIMAMRELNDALDISTLRGTDMEATQIALTAALAGNSKGVRFLGITTVEFNAIMKDQKLMTDKQATALHLTKAEQDKYNDAVEHHNLTAVKQAALLALIETKTKDGRKAQTELTQSTQALNKDWQDITTKVGPPLLSLFTGVVGWVDKLVTALSDLGKNKDWNKAISAGLGDIQRFIVATVKDLEAFFGWLNKVGGGSAGASAAASTQPFSGLAAGGPVSAGGIYTVGEHGPETLIMGSQSGNIIPNGQSGRSLVVNVNVGAGSFIDGPSIDMLVNRIASRIFATTGI
jgi:hypothetical protein